ncbi:Zinc finger BED domain-containing protein DAYSLEEPER [Trichoplax sp. H2]|nr:Zinc finger BED domain-containing protein DAYSLEEPER [Trichoplax sp. H2]|eukprot:RDD45069.1 Zinc finger BED domain-containing protein DAYSLEEPER [Trichoplax sp. H2]
MAIRLSECKNVVEYDVVKLAKLVDPRFPNNESTLDCNAIRQLLTDLYRYEAKESTQSASVLSRLLNTEIEDDNSSQDDEVSQFCTATAVRDVAADPLLWWKNNEKRFPTLARLARDVLCIPISCTPDHLSVNPSQRYQSTEIWPGHKEFMHMLLLCRNWNQLRVTT